MYAGAIAAALAVALNSRRPCRKDDTHARPRGRHTIAPLLTESTPTFTLGPNRGRPAARQQL